MAVFIGILIILMIIFMIFAMALAEWGNQDPGEFFQGWFKKKSPSRQVKETETTEHVLTGDKALVSEPVSAARTSVAKQTRSVKKKKTVTKPDKKTKKVIKKKSKKRTTT